MNYNQMLHDVGSSSGTTLQPVVGLLGVGKLQEDVGVGGEDVVVYLTLKLNGVGAKVQLLELDLALSELLVAADVVVHDLKCHDTKHEARKEKRTTSEMMHARTKIRHMQAK